MDLQQRRMYIICKVVMASIQIRFPLSRPVLLFYLNQVISCAVVIAAVILAYSKSVVVLTVDGTHRSYHITIKMKPSHAKRHRQKWKSASQSWRYSATTYGNDLLLRKAVPWCRSAFVPLRPRLTNVFDFPIIKNKCRY